jgi:hypothetical protein
MLLRGENVPIFSAETTHQGKLSIFRLSIKCPIGDENTPQLGGHFHRFNAHRTFRATPEIQICHFLIKIHLRPTPKKSTNIENHQQ